MDVCKFNKWVSFLHFFVWLLGMVPFSTKYNHLCFKCDACFFMLGQGALYSLQKSLAILIFIAFVQLLCNLQIIKMKLKFLYPAIIGYKAEVCTKVVRLFLFTFYFSVNGCSKNVCSLILLGLKNNLIQIISKEG